MSHLGRNRKKIRRRGARILRNEAYLDVRRSDEARDEAQRSIQTFYDVVIIDEFVKSHDGDDDLTSSRGKARAS